MRHTSFVNIFSTVRLCQRKVTPTSFCAETKEVSIIGNREPAVTPVELLQILCIIARAQIEVGNTEAAYLVLRRWYKFGAGPLLEDLSPESSAPAYHCGDYSEPVGYFAPNTKRTDTRRSSP